MKKVFYRGKVEIMVEVHKKKNFFGGEGESTCFFEKKQYFCIELYGVQVQSR
jgi:hypothetical protein